MNRGYINIRFILFIFATALARTSAAQLAPLANIPAVRVHIQLMRDGERPALNGGVIDSVLEARLRSGGWSVYTETEAATQLDAPLITFNVLAIPILTGNTSRANPSGYAVRYVCTLTELATLSRVASPVAATTWEASGVLETVREADANLPSGGVCRCPQCEAQRYAVAGDDPASPSATLSTAPITSTYP